MQPPVEPTFDDLAVLEGVLLQDPVDVLEARLHS